MIVARKACADAPDGTLRRRVKSERKSGLAAINRIGAASSYDVLEGRGEGLAEGGYKQSGIGRVMGIAGPSSSS